MAEMQRTLVTKEGLENMQKELDELRSVKRAEVAQRLNSRSVQHRSLKRERRTV